MSNEDDKKDSGPHPDRINQALTLLLKVWPAEQPDTKPPPDLPYHLFTTYPHGMARTVVDHVAYPGGKMGL